MTPVHDAPMDGLRFGRQFRALRIRLERRQSDVATDARLSRSQISLIDRGRIDGVTVGALVRAAAALGADLDVRLRWRGELLDRLLDESHAAVVELIVGRLRRLGWIVEVEVSFSIWGERGSIDVFAFHPGTRALLVVEVKSVIADSQATLHGLDRKVRLAVEVAKGRGWQPRHVSRLLVVAASATSRRRVARLATTWDAALPARGSIVRRWLAAPDGPIAGLLFVSNDSQDGTRRRSTGRERVRRRKRDQMTARKAIEPGTQLAAHRPVDTAAVAGK
jgi:transcriptional regulator with XRE-family HTH domain